MDIKDRIRKLLALATSPVEEEAKSAMLKAQELMAKYKIEEADLGIQKEQEVVRRLIEEVKWTTDSGWMWAVSLAREVAPHYCCESAWGTPYKTRSHYLVLVGYPDDLDVCEAVMKYAFGFVKSQIKRLEKMPDPKAAIHSYGEGFAAGVGQALSRQEESRQEWGLVVQVPKEAREYKSGLKAKEVRLPDVTVDPYTYLAGLEDGRKFDMKPGIEKE